MSVTSYTHRAGKHSVDSRIVLALVLTLASMALAGCPVRGEPSNPIATAPGSISGRRTLRTPVPEQILRGAPGLFLRRANTSRLEFIEWESETTASRAIASLRPHGGTVYFAPGRYTVGNGIFIHGARDTKLVAAPGVELVFPPARVGPLPRLAKPATEGDTHLTLDTPDALTVGGRYQLYLEKGRETRLLEFVVKGVEGTRITLDRPVKYMSHVVTIPARAYVIDEWNFFRVYLSNNVTIEGFTMDGLDRGEVIGHTMYSGILVVTGFHQARKVGAPLFSGFRVVGNTFKNLKGRGLAVYGTADIVVEGNRFANISTQAIEIDHFSSGRVFRNKIESAVIGIQLDDAFGTAVERNAIRRAHRAVVLLGHFDDPWVNTGNRIVGNVIVGPGAIGVSVSERSHDNIIARNRFTRIKESLSGSLDRNDVRENRSE